MVAAALFCWRWLVRWSNSPSIHTTEARRKGLDLFLWASGGMPRFGSSRSSSSSSSFFLVSSNRGTVNSHHG
jgi:hypothetical protein